MDHRIGLRAARLSPRGTFAKTSPLPPPALSNCPVNDVTDAMIVEDLGNSLPVPKAPDEAEKYQDAVTRRRKYKEKLEKYQQKYAEAVQQCEALDSTNGAAPQSGPEPQPEAPDAATTCAHDGAPPAAGDPEQDAARDALRDAVSRARAAQPALFGAAMSLDVLRGALHKEAGLGKKQVTALARVLRCDTTAEAFQRHCGDLVALGAPKKPQPSAPGPAAGAAAAPVEEGPAAPQPEAPDAATPCAHDGAPPPAGDPERDAARDALRDAVSRARAAQPALFDAAMSLDVLRGALHKEAGLGKKQITALARVLRCDTTAEAFQRHCGDLVALGAPKNRRPSAPGPAAGAAAEAVEEGPAQHRAIGWVRGLLHKLKMAEPELMETWRTERVASYVGLMRALQRACDGFQVLGPPRTPIPRRSEYTVGGLCFIFLGGGGQGCLPPPHTKSSGGSVDTTATRSGPQRVRMSSGKRGQ